MTWRRSVFPWARRPRGGPGADVHHGHDVTGLRPRSPPRIGTGGAGRLRQPRALRGIGAARPPGQARPPLAAVARAPAGAASRRPGDGQPDARGDPPPEPRLHALRGRAQCAAALDAARSGAGPHAGAAGPVARGPRSPCITAGSPRIGAWSARRGGPRAGMDDVHLVFLGYGPLRDELAEPQPIPVRRAHPCPRCCSARRAGRLGRFRRCRRHAQPAGQRQRAAVHPNKLFESMAVGLPVVSSDFTERRRIILDDPEGPLGAVCDPTSPGRSRPRSVRSWNSRRRAVALRARSCVRPTSAGTGRPRAPASSPFTRSWRRSARHDPAYPGGAVTEREP